MLTWSHNINWRDVQRKNVVNNENGTYKNQHTERQQKHIEHHDATQLCTMYCGHMGIGLLVWNKLTLLD